MAVSGSKLVLTRSQLVLNSFSIGLQPHHHLHITHGPPPVSPLSWLIGSLHSGLALLGIKPAIPCGLHTSHSLIYLTFLFQKRLFLAPASITRKIIKARGRTRHCWGQGKVEEVARGGDVANDYSNSNWSRLISYDPSVVAKPYFT